MRIKYFSLIFFCLSVLTNLQPLFPQNILLWNGETDDILNTDICWMGYGNFDSTEAYSGQWCARLTPDPWHDPILSMACHGNWRQDISGFDEIRFFIKSDLPQQTTKVRMKTWYAQSNYLDIDPYIVDGGLIDTFYKEVHIPIVDLQTEDYFIESIEYIQFNETTTGHILFVDELWAVDLVPNHITDHSLIANNVVRLDISDRYDTTDVKNEFNYSITSLTDTHFFNPVYPINVGMHYYVSDFINSYSAPVVEFELFLIFDDHMKNGYHYELIIYNVKDAADNNFLFPDTIEIAFDDAQYINGSVKTNQVGYLAESPKYGYIGNYLGGAGMMEISPTSFELRNAYNHQTIFTGAPVFRGYDPLLSGEKVYDCDFSVFSTPGSYYLYVPGVGRSADFAIDAAVFDSVYYHAAHAFYLQRCGTALVQAFAGPYSHATCHLNDGVIHETCANTSLYNPASDPATGTTVEALKGWHDAGDYGKYIPTAAISLFDLFTAYELFPEKFPDGFNNIPEGGNEIPDILDEIKWELDWMLAMQAPDGGVYFKITTTDWAGEMPEEDLRIRWFAEKTTHTTSLYCAVMAMAYRNFLPYDPVYATLCLDAAENAWNFLANHPDVVPEDGFVNQPGIGGGEYPDPSGDADDRAWAAAELYKSTGDTSYHQAFVPYWLEHPPHWGWNNFQHHQEKASWAYATTDFPVDSERVDLIKEEFFNNAQQNLIPRTNNNIYRCAHRSDVIVWIGYGSYGQSAYYSFELIKTGYLLDDPSYFEYAKINTDAQLGNNPQYRSYLTGVGYNTLKQPLQWPSEVDGVDEPVPGLPCFGPHNHLSNSNAYHRGVQDSCNLYPFGWDSNDPYPNLRRHYDIFELPAMSEFTIEPMAYTTATYAFFSSIDTATYTAPEVSLELTVLLEGPYSEEHLLMHDSLRTKSLLPFSEPFSSLGFLITGGAGDQMDTTLLTITGENAIVDWLMVELRDKSDPANIIVSQPSLIKRNGKVMDINGNGRMDFDVPPDQYYIGIAHRNHLSIMSNAPVLLTTTNTASVNFSDGSTATFGEQAQKDVNGKLMLWAGDITGDAVIKYAGEGNDRSPILLSIGGNNITNWLDGYLTEDVNLDGIVKYSGINNDRSVILQSIGGSVITNVRLGQVP